MKNLPTLALLILCMSGMAAQNPSFSSFDLAYFATNGYKISLTNTFVKIPTNFVLLSASYGNDSLGARGTTRAYKTVGAVQVVIQSGDELGVLDGFFDVGAYSANGLNFTNVIIRGYNNATFGSTNTVLLNGNAIVNFWDVGNEIHNMKLLCLSNSPLLTAHLIQFPLGLNNVPGQAQPGTNSLFVDGCYLWSPSDGFHDQQVFSVDTITFKDTSFNSWWDTSLYAKQDSGTNSFVTYEGCTFTSDQLYTRPTNYYQVHCRGVIALGTPILFKNNTFNMLNCGSNMMNAVENSNGVSNVFIGNVFNFPSGNPFLSDYCVHFVSGAKAIIIGDDQIPDKTMTIGAIYQGWGTSVPQSSSFVTTDASTNKQWTIHMPDGAIGYQTILTQATFYGDLYGTNLTWTDSTGWHNSNTVTGFHVDMSGGTVSARNIAGETNYAPTITFNQSACWSNAVAYFTNAASAISFTVVVAPTNASIGFPVVLWTNTFAFAYAKPPTVIGPNLVGGPNFSAGQNGALWVNMITTTNFTVSLRNTTTPLLTNIWSFLVFP